MTRYSVLMLVWLTAPVMFAMVPHALKNKDYLFAGIMIYLGLLGGTWFFGNLILMAGEQ